MQRYEIAQQIFDSIYHRPLDVVEEQSLLFNIYDRAPFRAATQALTGIELRDPTADKRIYEFCLSIPPEQYVVEGHSRSLARRAMKGRIPESVRLRYTRGLQSADWQMSLTEALPDIQQELLLQEQSPAVHQALDMPEIHRLLERWPTGGVDKPEVFRRWNFALLPALSLGYFLRSHEAARDESMSPVHVAVQ
jgi:asparagine synthase (glutamine-hydrolysing)